MQVYSKRQQLNEAVAKLKSRGLTIGFVPTMGALHTGHASLINQALTQSDQVVVSIFVNPTQFNNTQDLETYPRDIEQDLIFLKKLSENVIVFTPSTEDVYGSNVISTPYNFKGLEKQMEGKFRPGHFEGVGTVLKHLFTIVNPDKAFFGEKDFQQLQIVRKLVKIENLPVQIIGCPISRANDGLALSSRNKRLNAKHRAAAPHIYRILDQVKKDFDKKDILTLNKWVTAQFDNIPELDLEYFEIAEAQTLISHTQKKENTRYRAFIAAFAGDVRLIDNIALN